MIIKNILVDDFVNYKKPSMVILFPFCTFKCEREAKCQGLCQNTELARMANMEVSVDKIIKFYKGNTTAKALVFSGLEPFDSFDEMIELIKKFRQETDDDIVIFTGYNKPEIQKQVDELLNFTNIIIKFGRYIPNQLSHLDDVLGVKLASDNQYAEKIS